jgi:magnesium-transporting ATPase (P-type)
MNSKFSTTLWLRWVAANGLGEMFGLGLTFAVGVAVISRLGNQHSVAGILLIFLVAVASGAIEATVVGLAQWQAMHPWFPVIKQRAWWLATLVGALVAYVLGYLPSTLMSLGEQTSTSQATIAEPGQWLVLLLAAGLGAVGGAVLSFPQWITMRGKVQGASIWIPANMLAWMVGMPIIFWGIDAIQKLGNLSSIILCMGVILLLTGMVVGAIHGLFLTRLAKTE